LQRENAATSTAIDDTDDAIIATEFAVDEFSDEHSWQRIQLAERIKADATINAVVQSAREVKMVEICEPVRQYTLYSTSYRITPQMPPIHTLIW
jgi:hypothetical protein